MSARKKNDAHARSICDLRQTLERNQQAFAAKTHLINDQQTRINDLTELCNKLSDQCDRVKREVFLASSSSSERDGDDSSDDEALSCHEHA